MAGRYYKPNNSTIMYLNSSYGCIKSSSISLALTTAGTGYTSNISIIITPAQGDMGMNASATISQTGGVLNTLTIANNGISYDKLPTVTLSGGRNPGAITGYTWICNSANNFSNRWRRRWIYCRCYINRNVSNIS